ncbi:beta-1,6-N-acetylglucosaminyltransferase [Flavivirga algicola]|uniref:Peptide O-xylosyltransferase n=1 Tax=Flavivirga algicola TaxID=2729136 RepID=A0ABX1S169_9FLAO|nr:beta-1,6-N-acetylglucosaminyltransferase [Flavivirga algicola]NMH88174.1 beta-1,6-N-acetylglucosaminyltransferase [Flavivirga algicola]
MKQATFSAYKNFEHLADIIGFFDEGFEFYIHVDKKSKVPKAVLEKIRERKNVKILSQKYRVNWGGLNHLKSALFLADKALKESDNQYFHLISGQDFPIKNMSQFKTITNSSILKDYLEYFELPTENWANENGGFDRIQYYHLLDTLNAKKHIKRLWWFVRLQKKFSFKRTIKSKVPKLYGGSTWWSLSRETLQYVIDYTDKRPYLIKRLKYTFCPEEIYFQTVIMNSDFAKKVINDNLRYIDWENNRIGKYNASPAVLSIADFEKIIVSEKLFARKFEAPISDNLKAKLLKNKS